MDENGQFPCYPAGQDYIPLWPRFISGEVQPLRVYKHWNLSTVHLTNSYYASWLADFAVGQYPVPLRPSFRRNVYRPFLGRVVLTHLQLEDLWTNQRSCLSFDAFVRFLTVFDMTWQCHTDHRGRSHCWRLLLMSNQAMQLASESQLVNAQPHGYSGIWPSSRKSITLMGFFLPCAQNSGGFPWFSIGVWRFWWFSPWFRWRFRWPE